MQIKNRKTNFNISNIGFNETFSNFIFLVSLLFIFINWLVGLMGTTNLSPIAVLLWIIGINFIFIGIAAGPASVFEKNYDGEYRYPKIISDFKKGLIYLIVYFVITLSYIYYNKWHQPIKKDIHIKKEITKVIFTDIHKSDDSYGIRYYDKDNNNLFTDIYKKEIDRTKVYNKIFKKDGTPKSKIFFINNNGVKSVEIYLLNKSIDKN